MRSPKRETECSELDRRLAAHARSPDDVVSWEEVKRALLAGH